MDNTIIMLHLLSSQNLIIINIKVFTVYHY